MKHQQYGTKFAQELFFQDYTEESGIPSHWCLKYTEYKVAGYQYEYGTYEEMKQWAKDNCLNGETF